jgi:hypothetical protein
MKCPSCQKEIKLIEIKTVGVDQSVGEPNIQLSAYCCQHCHTVLSLERKSKN